jgi:entry exclusion lipoprotein TrbK
MNLRKGKTVALAVVVAALVAACGQKPAALPEVNDENCKPENVQKLADKAQQQEFSSACLHRGSFKASPARKW